MFTGIIEDMGTVVDFSPTGDFAVVSIASDVATVDARLGDSIAVNGTCLTVTRVDDSTFSADIMGETLKRSTLGGLRAGSRVNLERALAAGDRLGGHIVQGHVDAVGTILDVCPGTEWHVVRVSLPESIARLVVEKGSITVDGVSLTVSAVAPDDTWFEVSLIPETLERTTLGAAAPGTTVNLESDIVARHIDKLLSAQQNARVAS